MAYCHPLLPNIRKNRILLIIRKNGQNFRKGYISRQHKKMRLMVRRIFDDYSAEVNDRSGTTVSKLDLWGI